MKKKKRYKTAAFKRKLNADLRLIGKNLRTLRQIRKESLKSAAKAAFISGTHLSRIERGLVPRFKFTVLALLSIYYGVSMEDLVTRGLKAKLSKANFSTTKPKSPKLKKSAKLKIN